MSLSHLDAEGRAVMVDVSGKPRVRRTARAAGRLLVAPDTVRLIREKLLEKGDALAVARVAGIAAAKKTAELVPLCHNIRIDQVTVDFELRESSVEISSRADLHGEHRHRNGSSRRGCRCRAHPVRHVQGRGQDHAHHGHRPRGEDEGGRAVRREFAILSVNISQRTGEQKKPVERAVLRAGHGIEGDAHAGDWHRQVSLLAEEDIDTMRGRGIELGYGDFAENITTRGIDLGSLPLGARLAVGPAVLEVTQIGKECHQGCAIFQAVGDCVMPRRGIFTRVITGGEISRESRCHYDF